jgi:hypothetical protein
MIEENEGYTALNPAGFNVSYTAPMNQPTAPQDNHPSLWLIAREMLTLATLALGAPGLIAAIERLTAKSRRDILDWLAPLELLVRKLLLLEAAKLPRLAEPRRTPRRLTLRLALSLMRKRKTKKHIEDPNRPATWRVSFALPLPRERRYTPPPHKARISVLGRPVLVSEIHAEQAKQARANAVAACRAERAKNAARRLAQRFEAVRRVIADPAPHAARLARKLHRVGKDIVRVAQTLARAPSPRRNRGFAEAALVGATFEARAAVMMLGDTS